MMVGFPPFHCENGRNLEKRILSGIVRFPVKMDKEGRDLIEWLLSMNPNERPMEFSDVKKHPFFKDIHWGRVAKKEAIPPWVPDLYTSHVPKRFTQIPLNQVFHHVPGNKKDKRASHNPREVNNDKFKGSLYVHNQISDRVARKRDDREGPTFEEIMFLEGRPKFKSLQLSIKPNLNR